MNTTRIVAAFAGLATPALVLLGAGTAHASDSVKTAPPLHGTAITEQRPGHIAIHAAPPLVSPPLVWGPFDSVGPILDD